MRSTVVLGLVITAFVTTAIARSARACSARPLAQTMAFPATGATDVSPVSSIFLVWGQPEVPQGLVLTANGQSVAVPTIHPLGGGAYGQGNFDATFWQLRGPLLADATYVLSTSSGGVLTTFTTASSADKQAGQAPVLTDLRLWRVRYPVEDVGAGRCVFAEYEGYIDVNYQEGSVPGTPAEEVIAVISLEPRTGGSSQTFAFAGVGHFEGAPLWDAATQTQVDVPPGGLPSPLYAVWKPSLEGDREYCVTMTLYGRGAPDGPSVTSNLMCAKVMSVDARPAAGGGGCRLGRGHARAGWVTAFIGLALVWARSRRGS